MSRLVKILSATAIAATLAACSSVSSEHGASVADSSAGMDTHMMDPFNPNSPLAKNRSVYFAFDSYAVEAQFQPLVRMHAQYLATNPSQHVRIEGHTDVRGSSEYNLALGQRRSVAVARQLIQQGVNSAQIEAVSFGKERPMVVGSSEKAHAQNRRADINYFR